MMAHLPVLQIIVPLLAAPLCILIGAMLSRVLLWAGSLAMLLTSLYFLSATMGGDVFFYELGGWAAPWGIEYRIDALTAMVLVVINTVNFFASIYSLSGSSEVPESKNPIFNAAWLLCIAGLNGMVITNDAFNVFVFLEISSLSTYLLISCGRDPRALLSAFRYLITGSVGATFILLSIGLLYMQTGTLNITDISTILSEQGANRTTLLALGFFLIGISIKAAIFPLHDWLPNAYCFAPNAVTVLLSGTATKVSLYILIRFLSNVFGADFSFIHIPLGAVLITCSVLGMLIAPLIALRESNLKRMFAWSSVAQISYIALGVGLGSVAGTAAAMIHLFNHSLIKALIFMAVGILIARTGTARIKSLGGVAKNHRLACYVILFGGLGLIGIPGTVGFVSKWYLVSATIDRGWWWLAIPVLVGSLASAAYIWRIVETLWAKPVTDDSALANTSLQFTEWLPLIGLLVLTAWFGLNANFSGMMAESAAESVINFISVNLQ